MNFLSAVIGGSNQPFAQLLLCNDTPVSKTRFGAAPAAPIKVSQKKHNKQLTTPSTAANSNGARGTRKKDVGSLPTYPPNFKIKRVQTKVQDETKRGREVQKRLTSLSRKEVKKELSQPAKETSKRTASTRKTNKLAENYDLGLQVKPLALDNSEDVESIERRRRELYAFWDEEDEDGSPKAGKAKQQEPKQPVAKQTKGFWDDDDQIKDEMKDGQVKGEGHKLTESDEGGRTKVEELYKSRVGDKETVEQDVKTKQKELASKNRKQEEEELQAKAGEGKASSRSKLRAGEKVSKSGASDKASKTGSGQNPTSEQSRDTLRFKFLDAALNDNVFLLQQICNQNPDLDLNTLATSTMPTPFNMRDLPRFEGWGALHILAWTGSTDTLESLLDATASSPSRLNINLITGQGQTALHLAALRGNAEVAEMLLGAKATVDADNRLRFNQTPLHVAALKGHSNVIKVLLKHGASLESECGNPKGPTRAFQLAGALGHKLAFSQLLQAGAETSTVENDLTCIVRAAKGGHVGIIDELVPKFRPTDVEFTDAVAYAVFKRRVDVVKILLAAAAHSWAPLSGYLPSGVQIASGVQGTPVHLAAAMCRLDILRIMMEHGGVSPGQDKVEDKASRNFFNELELKFSYASPFMCVIRSRGLKKGTVRDEDVAATVDYLAKCQDYDLNGAQLESNLLLEAIKKGLPATCKVLIDNGADVRQDYAENYPIHQAIKQRLQSIVTMLLEAQGVGDEICNLPNGAGQTALHLAVEMRELPLVACIIKHHAAKKSVDLNKGIPKKLQETALHIAARNGKPDIVELLLKNGANPNVKLTSISGPKTPLDVAVAHKRDEVVSIFAHYGVNLTKDSKKKTDSNEKVQFALGDDKIPRQFLTMFSKATMTHAGSWYPSATPLNNSVSLASAALDALLSGSVNAGTGAVNSAPWRTVRLFISSTFVDFVAERDYIIKRLVPELSALCVKRHLHLVPVDLRWGVTGEEAASGKVLELCLSEVRKCDLFIGLLGDRYGWVPNPQQIPEHVRLLYNWESGRSVTAMEVVEGVLKNSRPSASKRHVSMFVRELGGDMKAPKFRDEDPELLAKMIKLRGDIEKAGVKITSYKADLQVVDNKHTVRVSDLDKWGRSLLNRLWDAVQTQFPVQTQVVSPLDTELQYHLDFAETRTRNFTGREKVLQELFAYMKSDSFRPMAVVGEPGSGKSTLMGHFARKYAETDKDSIVLVHFVGASPNSVNVREMLWALCWQMKRKFGCLEMKTIEESYEGLCSQFSQFCDIISKESLRKLVVVIDAVNQLDPEAYAAHSLQWLPVSVQKGVKIIVSVVPGNLRLALANRVGGSEIFVGPLTKEDCQEIIQHTLVQYNKRLDASQLGLLLSKTDATHPLYLVVACEELRVFGVYEEVSERIRKMPEKIPGLMVQVLERLEADHGVELVSLALSLLECSRHGMVEIDMLQILRQELGGGVDTSTDLQWGQLFFSLSFFLRPISKGHGEGLLDFFHRQVAKAVRNRYDIQRAHRIMATYLERKLTGKQDTEEVNDPEDDPYAESLPHHVSELPYHLYSADLTHILKRVLSDLRFVARKCALGQLYDLLADYTRVLTVKTETSGDVFAAVPNTTGQDFTSLQPFYKFLLSSAHIIGRHPQLVLQQALNQTEFPVLSNAALAILNRQKESSSSSSHSKAKPFIEWANRPTSQSINELFYMSLVGPSQCNCLSFGHGSSQGVLAAGYKCGAVVVWDLATGKTVVLHKNAHTQRVTQIAYSCDGEYIVSTGADGVAKAWHGSTGQPRKVIHVAHAPSTPILCLAMSKTNSTLMYTGGDDALIVISNTASANPVQTLAGHEGPVTALDVFSVPFSPSERVISGSADKTIRVWDSKSSSPLATLNFHSKTIKDVRFSPDGTRFASCGQDQKLGIWDFKGRSATMRHDLNHHTDTVASAVWTQDGQYVVSGSWDKSCRAVRVDDGLEVMCINSHGHFLNAVALSPTSAPILATASVDFSIKLHEWDVVLTASMSLGNRESVPISAPGPQSKKDDDDDDPTEAAQGQDEASSQQPHNKLICEIKCAPKIGVVATASWDRTARIMALKDGRVTSKVKFTGHSKRVNTIVISPCNRYVLTGSTDSTLKVWDVETGAEISTMKGHKAPVFASDISFDSQYAASGSGDHAVGLWELGTGTNVYMMQGHTCWVTAVSFTPYSRFIVSGSVDGEIRVWKTETAVNVCVIKQHTAPVLDLQFSPDGKWMVSSAEDRTALVWDSSQSALSEAPPRCLRGHTDEVTGAAFFKGSQSDNTTLSNYIITVASDRSLRIWDLSQKVLVPIWEVFGSVNFMTVDTFDHRTIVVGDALGGIRVFTLHNFETLIPFVQPQ